MNDNSGCLLSMVFDNNGKCLAYQGKDDLKANSMAKMSQAMAEVTSALEKLSVELEIMTGHSCLPQEGWIYLGSSIAAIMVNGGYRGVVLDSLNSDQMEVLKKSFGLVENSVISEWEGFLQQVKVKNKGEAGENIG
jgi:roadblock/LC7 domain-containing protein